MTLEDFIVVGNNVSYKDVLSDGFYSDYFATKEYNRMREIEYFEKDKLEQSKIAIKDGKLYTADGKLLTTDEREFLFVLSKDNQFYGCYDEKM